MKPNILFIFTDQLRWDALGCTGGWVKTPNIDRIAAEGVLFENCVTNSPVCIPARVSLATGLYPHSTGVWNNCEHTLSPEADTWMQRVRDAGYRTSLFGKTHLHPHSGDIRDREHLMHSYGLDDVDEIGGPRASAWLHSHMTERWEKLGLWEAYKADYADRFGTKPHVVRPSVLPLEEYADIYVGQRAREYLDAYDRDEPWMCWVSFGGPHEPWDTPEPFASMHKEEDMPSPAPATEFPEGLSVAIDRKNRYNCPITPEDVKKMRRDYAGNVALIDEQIGQIFDVLEKRGELDKTIIAFSSDHGELNGDHGFVYKNCFFNGCARIPMILRTPETAKTGSVRRCSSPVELLDLGPTLCELAGAEVDYPQFGVSLAPALDDPDVQLREHALSEIVGETMILTQDWKCAVNADGKVYQLYRVPDDPLEQHNLADDPAYGELRLQLKEKMLEHILQSRKRIC